MTSDVFTNIVPTKEKKVNSEKPPMPIIPENTSVPNNTPQNTEISLTKQVTI